MWLSTFLAWQILIVCLFLPLDFVYQSVIAFLAIVLIADLLPDYLWNGFSRERVFATSSVIFSFLALVLASAKWWI